ncbi:MAG TPA: TolC family protein [Kofleriaceae bacterium]|jgi:outer membrane protein|nr:TolC family protein [Kofleriaceae bacterium]
MKLVSLAFLAALSSVALAQPGVTRPAPAPPPAGNPPPNPAGNPAPSPVLAAPVDPMAPVNSNGGEVLTLDRAIEIAMRQQPSLRQSQAALEAARGRVDLARVGRNPTVVLDGTVGTGSSIQRGTLNPNGTVTGGGPDFFSHSESTGLGATANWRLYDFGQTSANIRAAERSADAFAATIGTTTLDIRTNVEVAYLTAVADRKLVIVAQTTVRSEDGHLDQARRFVAAQAHDPIEVAQAQARLANAKSALAQAQSNEAIALANLRSAIGWVDPTRSPTVAPNWPVPPETEPQPLTALVDSARKNRPEIVQLDKLLEAANASLDAAHAERRPVLSATAQSQWSPGTGDWSPQPTWSAGLQLSVPLFDGGRASADIRIANANVLTASANRDALLVTLTSQLDAARAEIVANHANVAASTEAVAAARAQLQLSEARYAQGLGSQIELADAQTAVTTAEGNLVQAEFQLASAWAQLHRAVAQQ